MRQSSVRTLGLDIGGANLKAATASGEAITVPFPLWRSPGELTDRLRDLLQRFPHDRLAVTMTAELCDCFATKREGVRAIVDSVESAAQGVAFKIWSTRGVFVTAEEARADPWRVASANWHALATFAGQWSPTGPALLLDIGSTTTDIVPIVDGRPTPRGFTDSERLATGELVYTGVRRTPLCAILGAEAAAELFATTHDVYLLLGMMSEEVERRDTADSRPATVDHAHARLARMRCSDREAFSRAEAMALAREVHQRQVAHLVERLGNVVRMMPAAPRAVILSGSGEFLGRLVIEQAGFEGVPILSLGERLSAPTSVAACAYALAVLAEGDW